MFVLISEGDLLGFEDTRSDGIFHLSDLCQFGFSHLHILFLTNDIRPNDARDLLLLFYCLFVLFSFSFFICFISLLIFICFFFVFFVAVVSLFTTANDVFFFYQISHMSSHFTSSASSSVDCVES